VNENQTIVCKFEVWSLIFLIEIHPWTQLNVLAVDITPHATVGKPDFNQTVDLQVRDGSAPPISYQGAFIAHPKIPVGIVHSQFIISACAPQTLYIGARVQFLEADLRNISDLLCVGELDCQHAIGSLLECEVATGLHTIMPM
jgi:hypothetical protein